MHGRELHGIQRLRLSLFIVFAAASHIVMKVLSLTVFSCFMQTKVFCNPVYDLCVTYYHYNHFFLMVI